MGKKQLMKVYGTKICSECVEAFGLLKQAEIEYEYLDITESTTNLKEFLRLRDVRSEFEEIKKNGYIGIPCYFSAENLISFSTEEVIAAKNNKVPYNGVVI